MEKKTGFLVIADISGFTEFIKIHNMKSMPLFGGPLASYWESHAEQLIRDLLEAVIDSLEPFFTLNKIEGDAAFFWLEDGDVKKQAADILQMMEKAQAVFRAKLADLKFVESCPCDPCQQSKNLRLKIVVHRGAFQLTKIRNFTELAGESVIFVHRLLKNGIKSDEYWLFSKQVSDLLENRSDLVEVTEKIESFGKQKLAVRYFDTDPARLSSLGLLSRIRQFPKMLTYYK